jgi:PhzF family phenazine biosynthesis protein
MAKKATTRRGGKAKAARRVKSASRTPKKFAVRKLPLFTVDAFTTRRFHGNPAAIVLLDDGKWLPDDTMQAIAAENNLSETAFIRRKGKTGPMAIRWMTPTVEVDLCGHATLAAAHVLWNHAGCKDDKIAFSSRSGRLTVSREDGRIVLDFPALPGKKVPVTNAMCDALGKAPVEAFMAGKLMCVFENRRDVYQLQPDLAKVARLDCDGVIVTAPGSGHDFVSRYFVPQGGIDEDPVTGSSHCTLAPYWAHVLGKKHLTAHQTSKRGGELWCEVRGSRVRIGGHAVTVSMGSMLVDVQESAK